MGEQTKLTVALACRKLQGTQEHTVRHKRVRKETAVKLNPFRTISLFFRYPTLFTPTTLS